VRGLLTEVVTAASLAKCPNATLDWSLKTKRLDANAKKLEAISFLL